MGCLAYDGGAGRSRGGTVGLYWIITVQICVTKYIHASMWNIRALFTLHLRVAFFLEEFLAPNDTRIR